MKYLTLRNSIYFTAIIYVCSFLLSYYDSKNDITNVYLYISSEEEPYLKEHQELTSSKAFERFKHIVINNENVVILNYIGALSLGLSSIAQIAFNGYTLGKYIGIYSIYMPLNTIIKYTLPHSFELIPIIFSSGEGLYIGISLFLCLFGYKNIKDYNSREITIHVVLCTVTIVLAAFVEAYITMSL